MLSGAGTGRRAGLMRLALLAALGAVTATGLAPLGWWWLALPALSLLIWRLSAVEGAWRAARAGWFAGAGYFAAAMFWIYDPFLVDPGDLWMAPFAVIGMAFGMGLFWALAAGLAVPLGGGQRGRALAFAVLLTATGLLRTYMLTGFPWALIGHIWIGAWPAQIAALGGAVLL
ncbi:apolipoprotein N-acyltransferase, partial [Thioclava sp. BHET1]